MDLWIKSTDGSLIKVDNLRIKQHKYLDPTRIVWTIITEKRDFLSENYLFLGKYRTRERALEILNEIQELLQTRICFENYNSLNLVYEMPKE